MLLLLDYSFLRNLMWRVYFKCKGISPKRLDFAPIQKRKIRACEVAAHKASTHEHDIRWRPLQRWWLCFDTCK